MHTAWYCFSLPNLQRSILAFPLLGGIKNKKNCLALDVSIQRISNAKNKLAKEGQNKFDKEQHVTGSDSDQLKHPKKNSLG